TLDADKTLTAPSGALPGATIQVAAGTTLADGGHQVILGGGAPANVVVDGSWQSTDPGLLAFVGGTGGSSLEAADLTQFGDLVVNFASSADSLRLVAATTSGITLRNLTLGGNLGAGTAGGSLLLSAGGITNLIVTGAITRAPTDPAASG